MIQNENGRQRIICHEKLYDKSELSLVISFIIFAVLVTIPSIIMLKEQYELRMSAGGYIAPNTWYAGMEYVILISGSVGIWLGYRLWARFSTVENKFLYLMIDEEGVLRCLFMGFDFIMLEIKKQIDELEGIDLKPHWWHRLIFWLPMRESQYAHCMATMQRYSKYLRKHQIIEKIAQSDNYGDYFKPVLQRYFMYRYPGGFHVMFKVKGIRRNYPHEAFLNWHLNDYKLFYDKFNEIERLKSVKIESASEREKRKKAEEAEKNKENE